MAKLNFYTLFFILSISCGELFPVELSDKRTNLRSMIEPSDLDKATVIDNKVVPKYKRPVIKSPIEKIGEDFAKQEFKKDQPIVGIFKYSLLANADPESLTWITKQVKIPKNKDAEVLSDEFIHIIKLENDVSGAELLEEIAYDDAVITLDVDSEVSLSFGNDLGLESGFSFLDLNPSIKSYYKNLASTPQSKRVKVGVIDTGLSSKLSEFSESFKNPLLTNVLEGSSQITDKHGHGTQMAAIIAGKKVGIAPDSVEIIPLLVSHSAEVSTRTLAQAIVVGTNLGVEVMNISISGKTRGCTPVIGHVIYRAIEKGVFFSFSAGNGIKHIPEEKVGYPLTAANDDGPLNFQNTQMPACWGKYFLGAITAGAIGKKDSVPQMPMFSNYGRDVELVAPGQNEKTIGHLGSKISTSGTSASAAYVSAAAALAIHHHKVNGFHYTPWYIENLLVQSALPSDHLLSVERRPRFGAILNFARLAALLEETEKLSEDQRKNIPTVNPRYNEGWKPGRESNLDKLRISYPSSRFKVGKDQGLKATVFYNHNTKEKDVTTHKNNHWLLSLANEADVLKAKSSKEYLSISQEGIVHLPADKLKKLRSILDNKDQIEFIALNVYDEDQHQVFRKFPFVVYFNELPVEDRVFEIEKQLSSFRVGQAFNWFKAWVVAFDKDGSELYRDDVTGGALWESSKTSEFTPAIAPGIFSALNSRIGETYTVEASYDGLAAETDITMEHETPKGMRIHNFLGDGGNIVMGQTIVLQSNVEFGNRDEPVRSDWYLDGKLLVSDKSKISLDTAATGGGLLKDIYFKMGKHKIEARASVKTQSGEKKLNAVHDFDVNPEISRIEIHLKDSIIREGGETLLNVRAYYNNNSYVIVTPEISWASTHPRVVNIQKSGKATIAKYTAGTKVTLSASFYGKHDSAQITVIGVSTVTGSGSKLVDLEIKNMPNNFFCEPRNAMRVDAIYENGLRREVSASISTEIIDSNGQVIPFNKHTVFGGQTLRIHYAYNDGSEASGGGSAVMTKEFVLPKDSSPMPQLGSLDYQYFEPTNDIYPSLFINWLHDGSVVSDDYYFPGKSDEFFKSGVYVPTCVRNFSYKTSQPQVHTGNKTITMEWDYNGSGESVHYSVPIDIVVNEFVDQPTKLIAGDRLTGSATNEIIVQQTGMPQMLTLENYLWFKNGKGVDKKSLRYNSGAINYFDDFYEDGDVAGYEISDSGQDIPIDVAKINQNQNQNGCKNFRACYLSFICTDETLNAKEKRFKFQDSQTNTESSWKITLLANSRVSAFDDYSQQKNISLLPEREVSPDPIPTKPNNRSFCDSDKKSMTPYAGGTGVISDPYLICSKAQLLRYREGQWTIKNGFGRLMAHIDFGGETIPTKIGTRIALDGQGYEVRNFVLIDSEKSYVSLLGVEAIVINLGIRGATIRGGATVGAVCAQCNFVNNVYVSDSQVIGESRVGAIAGMIKSGRQVTMFDLKNDNTHVSSYGREAGGIAGNALGAFERISNSGKITHIGVPDAGGNMGGIFGVHKGNIANALNIGNILASGDFVGGIVGKGNGEGIIHAENRGHIANQGAYTGGIAGAFYTNWETEVYHAINRGPAEGFEEYIFRAYNLDEVPFVVYRGGISYSKNTGNVWGGKNLEYLYCKEGAEEVLGSQGNIECRGDESNSIGGKSYIGGIVGDFAGRSLNHNTVVGNVRGVDYVGGMAGQIIVPKTFFENINLQYNSYSGLMGASDADPSIGKAIGYLKAFHSCYEQKHFDSTFNHWFAGMNFDRQSPDKINWSIGTLNTNAGVVRRYR